MVQLPVGPSKRVLGFFHSFPTTTFYSLEENINILYSSIVYPSWFKKRINCVCATRWKYVRQNVHIPLPLLFHASLLPPPLLPSSIACLPPIMLPPSPHSTVAPLPKNRPQEDVVTWAPIPALTQFPSLPGRVITRPQPPVLLIQWVMKRARRRLMLVPRDHDCKSP